MAVFALTAEYLTINSVDYTSYLKSAVLTLDAAQLDTTDFASGGWTEVIGGLKSGTLTVELMDDMADNENDEDLFALFGTVVAFALKPVATTISASNPEYQGNVLINSFNIGGAVGDLAMKSFSFPISGAITRDVTA